jgi:WD40 repeat protein
VKGVGGETTPLRSWLRSEPRASASGFAASPKVLAPLLLTLTLFAKPPAPIAALAFSPDGAWLVSGGYHEVLIWNSSTGKLARKIGGLSGRVRALTFSPDGKLLAVAGGMAGQSGTAVLVEFSTGAVTPISTAKDELLAVAFSPDGKLVAAGGANNIAEVWNVADKRLVATLKDHTGWITGLAFSPDGKLLATSSVDQRVRVWFTATWKSDFELPEPAAGMVTGVAFAPEGDFLAFSVAGDDEHSIRTWKPQNAFVEPDPNRPNLHATLLQTRPIDTGGCLPQAVAFFVAPKPAKGDQPHSRILAACSDHTARLIGTGGNTIATRSAHADWVYAVAPNADGIRYATGGGDGIIKIWGAGEKPLFTLTEEVK